MLAVVYTDIDRSGWQAWTVWACQPLEKGNGAMVVNYIIREVSPDAARVSSYPHGKSYTGEHFDDVEDAASFAIRCNECCVLPGIRYFVLPC